MAASRQAWYIGPLLMVALIAVPGCFLLLQTWGYLPGALTIKPAQRQSGAIVAPDFSLPDQEGNIRRLSSFRGRVVLLNFWATWCPPCRAEMPSLEALYQSFKLHGFAVVAVASDVQGIEAVQPFMAQHRLTFLPLLDTSSHVTRTYGVTTLPTSYILDREGRLVTVEIGSRDWTATKTRALIASLLEDRPQATPREGAWSGEERSSGAELELTAGR